MEEIKKRRGRPSKAVQSTDVQQTQPVEVVCNESVAVEESQSDVVEEVVEKTLVVEEEITEEVAEKQTIEKQTRQYEVVTDVDKEATPHIDSEEIKKYCTHHNYKIGDKAWVPVNVVKNVGSVFGTIHAIQLYEPKRVTVASVIITNHICYSFKESTKLIVAEKYMCDTQCECVNMCNTLMGK